MSEPAERGCWLPSRLQPRRTALPGSVCCFLPLCESRCRARAAARAAPPRSSAIPAGCMRSWRLSLFNIKIRASGALHLWYHCHSTASAFAPSRFASRSCGFPSSPRPAAATCTPAPLQRQLHLGTGSTCAHVVRRGAAWRTALLCIRSGAPASCACASPCLRGASAAPPVPCHLRCAAACSVPAEPTSLSQPAPLFRGLVPYRRSRQILISRQIPRSRPILRFRQIPRSCPILRFRQIPRSRQILIS